MFDRYRLSYKAMNRSQDLYISPSSLQSNCRRMCAACVLPYEFGRSFTSTVVNLRRTQGAKHVRAPLCVCACNFEEKKRNGTKWKRMQAMESLKYWTNITAFGARVFVLVRVRWKRTDYLEWCNRLRAGRIRAHRSAHRDTRRIQIPRDKRWIYSLLIKQT